MREDNTVCRSNLELGGIQQLLGGLRTDYLRWLMRHRAVLSVSSLHGCDYWWPGATVDKLKNTVPMCIDTLYL